MSHAASASAPPAVERLPTRPSAAAASAASIFDSLPADLLVSIFAFTPVGARLLTLSLVCKRWHAAALRSVRHVALHPHTTRTDTGARLSALLASIFPRLPSLTSVAITANYLHDIPLPTTLTRLSLRPSHLRGRAFLKCTFPHLVAFRCHSATVEGRFGSDLVAFVARHPGLTSLKLSGPIFEEDLAGIAQAGLPALRKLAIGSLYELDPKIIADLIRSAPRLVSLSLTGEAAITARSLPHTLLSSLKLLHVMRWDDQLDDELVAHFAALPSLRSLYIGFESSYSDAATERLPHLRGTLSLSAANANCADLLARFPNISYLSVRTSFTGELTPATLPRLRGIAVHPSPKAFTYARESLRFYRPRDQLSVGLEGSAEEVRAQAATLCAEGVRCGLRTLSIHATCLTAADTTHVARHGWICFRLETYGLSKEDELF